jgi:ArsR family transcriptional regulator
MEQHFKALADSTRLRILNLLLQGELCVCDIQYVLEISQPNASRHLSYLKNSGIVLDRRDGYRIFYCLSDSKDRTKRLLYGFLREAFRNQQQMKEDRERLNESIVAGSCVLRDGKSTLSIGVSSSKLNSTISAPTRR